MRTYPDPENVFHLEIFRLRLAIQLHDLAKRRMAVLRVVGRNQVATGASPKVVALRWSCLAFFPAGV